MHFTIAAVAAALVAGVSAAGYANGTVYTTEVVTAYTTYCPAATSLVYGNYTYTVTEATTLTITNCPCTITKPIVTSSAAPYVVPTSSIITTTSVAPTSSAAPTYANSTVSITSYAAAGTAVTTVPATTSAFVSPVVGGAGQAFVVNGGLLAGLAGLVALML